MNYKDPLARDVKVFLDGEEVAAYFADEENGMVIVDTLDAEGKVIPSVFRPDLAFKSPIYGLAVTECKYGKVVIECSEEVRRIVESDGNRDTKPPTAPVSEGVVVIRHPSTMILDDMVVRDANGSQTASDT